MDRCVHLVNELPERLHRRHGATQTLDVVEHEHALRAGGVDAQLGSEGH